MQPIAELLAKKATQRTARDRAITDRRELCRTSLGIERGLGRLLGDGQRRRSLLDPGLQVLALGLQCLLQLPPGGQR